MRRRAAIAALSAAVLIGLAGQSAYDQWHLPDGTGVIGTVIYCATGKPREAAPCGSNSASPMTVLSMPFIRATMDPVRFEGVTTTAKTFAISRPAGATSYRFANPCDVDVRIRKVDGPNDVITATQGTMFLARTVETLGTSDPQYVSLIAMKPPSGPCTPELGYGNGG